MATSKTVSSVSNSDKQDTNKESVSYLVFGTYENGNLDSECYMVINKPMTLAEIVDKVHGEWDGYELEKLRILPIKMSQIKRIKQTLELV